MRKLCRIFFSRYAICALLILFEILLLTTVFALFSYYSALFLSLSALLSGVTLLIIINRDGDPDFKLTWAVIVLTLPYMGTVLYFLFRTRRMSRREIRIIQSMVSHAAPRPSGDSAMDELGRADRTAAGRAMSLMRDDPQARLCRGSNTVYYPSGEAMFAAMLEAVRTAEHYIFLEYFIIERGVMWDRLHEELLDRVRAGVEVRLLYDDIGCMSTLPAYYDRALCAEGIRAHRFSPVTPRASTVHNNRDHRKILAVDGRVAFTGGINLADEYINERERFGHWKDGGVQIRGEAVYGFVNMFLSAWELTVGAAGDREPYLGAVRPVDSDGGYYLPFGSGPLPLYRRPGGKRAFLEIINGARNYLYITTPYLIIGYELTEALRSAAMRGVDVRIITPMLADKKIVKVMTKSFYPTLLEAGVRIYEYTPGFIHEKVLVADDLYCVIGTINFDFRSFAHHFEDGIWMYRSPTAVTVREEFLRTVEKSCRITPDGARLRFHEWVVKCGVKLFAPLL